MRLVDVTVDDTPAERPSPAEYADTVQRPCGCPSCSPMGCFSRRCWVDEPDDGPEAA